MLTRSLQVDAFATYAAVLAAYAFANALVGTTIGTRAIQGLSAEGHRHIVFNLRRDLPPVVGCLFVAAATTLIVKIDPAVALAAAIGMLGILVAELGGAYPLGLRRYWTYAQLTLVQMVLWVGTVIAAATLLPSSERLAVCLAAAAVGALPYVVYLVGVRGVVFTAGAQEHGSRVPISGVGIANFALWILASGDRLILAHYALAALATYAALYGLLERIFRTVANAEIQQRLPRAFISHAHKKESPDLFTVRAWLFLVVLGVVCSVAGPTAISIISGGHYHPSLAMSAVLAFAMMTMLAAVPAYVSLIARGRGRAVAVVSLTAAAVNIAGNLALAPHYGTSSAAVLTLVGYLIWLGGVTLVEHNARRLPAREALTYQAHISPMAYGD
ncbi:MAG: polysaccharide biosynthesis C-terminal domain-containing protein [Solirubrobacteraceae bacterium]